MDEDGPLLRKQSATASPSEQLENYLSTQVWTTEQIRQLFARVCADKDAILAQSQQLLCLEQSAKSKLRE